MYKRFNLEIDTTRIEQDLYVNSGTITEYKKEFKKDKEKLYEKVKKRFQSETQLNGIEITNEWFPQNKWDVFISHSHADEELAIHLAAWLKREFDLNVFLDSFVWGSSNDLLKLIDNEYCVLQVNGDKTTYNYNKRNYSTSHVHMMLSGALSDVIYNTECIIFLNTPNSLNINDLESKETNSPWIYSEIKTSLIVARKYPRKDFIEERILRHDDSFYQAVKEKLVISYDLSDNLNEFTNLSLDELVQWKNIDKENNNHPLDNLYFKVKNRLNNKM